MSKDDPLYNTNNFIDNYKQIVIIEEDDDDDDDDSTTIKNIKKPSSNRSKLKLNTCNILDTIEKEFEKQYNLMKPMNIRPKTAISTIDYSSRFDNTSAFDILSMNKSSKKENNRPSTTLGIRTTTNQLKPSTSQSSLRPSSQSSLRPSTCESTLRPSTSQSSLKSSNSQKLLNYEDDHKKSFLRSSSASILSNKRSSSASSKSLFNRPHTALGPGSYNPIKADHISSFRIGDNGERLEDKSIKVIKYKSTTEEDEITIKHKARPRTADIKGARIGPEVLGSKFAPIQSQLKAKLDILTNSLNTSSNSYSTTVDITVPKSFNKVGLSPSFFPSMKNENMKNMPLPGPGTYDTGNYRKSNSAVIKFATTSFGYNDDKIINLVEPEVKMLDIENCDIADLESTPTKDKSELEIAKSIIIRNKHNVGKLTPDIKKKMIETMSSDLENKLINVRARTYQLDMNRRNMQKIIDLNHEPPKAMEEYRCEISALKEWLVMTALACRMHVIQDRIVKNRGWHLYWAVKRIASRWISGYRYRKYIGFVIKTQRNVKRFIFSLRLKFVIEKHSKVRNPAIDILHQFLDANQNHFKQRLRDGFIKLHFKVKTVQRFWRRYKIRSTWKLLCLLLAFQKLDNEKAMLRSVPIKITSSSINVSNKRQTLVVKKDSTATKRSSMTAIPNNEAVLVTNKRASMSALPNGIARKVESQMKPELTLLISETVNSKTTISAPSTEDVSGFFTTNNSRISNALLENHDSINLENLVPTDYVTINIPRGVRRLKGYGFEHILNASKSAVGRELEMAIRQEKLQKIILEKKKLSDEITLVTSELKRFNAEKDNRKFYLDDLEKIKNEQIRIEQQKALAADIPKGKVNKRSSARNSIVMQTAPSIPATGSRASFVAEDKPARVFEFIKPELTSNNFIANDPNLSKDHSLPFDYNSCFASPALPELLPSPLELILCQLNEKLQALTTTVIEEEAPPPPIEELYPFPESLISFNDAEENVIWKFLASVSKTLSVKHSPVKFNELISELQESWSQFLLPEEIVNFINYNNGGSITEALTFSPKNNSKKKKRGTTVFLPSSPVVNMLTHNNEEYNNSNDKVMAPLTVRIKAILLSEIKESLKERHAKWRSDMAAYSAAGYAVSKNFAMSKFKSMNFTQKAHLLLGNTTAALEIQNETDSLAFPTSNFIPEPIEIPILENEPRSPTTLSPALKSKKSKKDSTSNSSDILTRKIAINDANALKRKTIPSYPHISMRLTLSEFEKIRNKCAKESKYLDFMMENLN